MPTRSALLLILMISMASCGGGDKHLPSSNPPEYDPNKVYTTPAAPPTAPATVATPTEFERFKAQLESLEAGQKAKGEGKKIPFDQNSLRLFKGVTTPCEALLRLVPRVGSAQLFEEKEGVALRKALGPDAEGIAHRMDEQVAESLKRSLAPGAADCPISVRPRKNSRFIDQSQPPRLVLAHTTPDLPLLLAQTTVPETSQDDYNVQKSSSRENAPPDWVGYKSMETMQRIGKEGRPTQGIREDYMMIIAPKAKRCPDSEGWVEGTFEWFIILYRATPDQGVLYRRHVVAELKGKVDDDAKVQYVDFDARITLQHIGTQLTLYSHTYGSRGRFTIDQQMMGVPQEFRTLTVSDFSAGEAEAIDANLVANLTLIVAYFSGLTYFEAQTEWNKPNTCVEITFTPATKTKKFVPSESTPVKTELRTKKEQAIVPAKFKGARERPREGNGRVSPREEKSELNRPATFTYQTPATKVQHSGFWVSAKSRAGVAEVKDGEWELAPSAYVLEFKSRIVQEPTDVLSSWGLTVSANGFDAQVEARVPLQHTEDRGWVGQGVMHYVTRTTTHPTLCEIRIQGTGTTTFHVNGGSISLDPEPFAVKLIILPGQTEEMAVVHCESTTARGSEKIKELLATQGVQGGNAHSSTRSGGWRAAFNLSRFLSFIWTPGRQGYEIGGWTQVLNSDIVAKKTMSVDCGRSAGLGATLCQEETTLTLKLADEPSAGASPRP
ncbi:MAG: hypothetical protein NW202_02915 [Nitrospira sp.]|nr:hypothetical protein [Nitrospira sp.]